MTNRHDSLRAAFAQAQEESTNHYALAEHWLNEADQRQTAEAGRQCLMAAHVHALLAIADAVRRHTELIEGRPVTCGVHCVSLGC